MQAAKGLCFHHSSMGKGKQYFFGKDFKKKWVIMYYVFWNTVFLFCELCFVCFAMLGRKGKPAEHKLIWKFASVNF